ncbi:kelch domain-containing protein 2-like [Halichondria panicea]|uniref:kelch domain-containing protein 2-like n=1 Tax=Halichondria panicea TaxID=6063 RepID=UPI00312BAAD6
MDASVEPSPRYGQFSAVDGRHYMWRGYGPGRGSNIIAVYDPSTELWSLLPTTGPLPPGEAVGCSVCVGRCLYTFGGSDESSYFNDMSKLDLDTLQWTKVQTSGSQPMKKTGCGLVRVNERTLCCFGGFGIEGTTQPGSTFTKIGYSDGRGWTNKFHFLDTQNGVWSSPELRGERPPCSNFTFTMVDQHRAVLFGGWQSGRSRVNDVYLFNFSTMEVTKVKPVQGEPWPVERSGHAACCLNYGQDHPQLLVYGGLDNGNKPLGDMWILDVDTVQWTEVTPPESMTPRHYHSITATSLGPGLTEVLVFGGLRERLGDHAIAETTILRFEMRLLAEVRHPNLVQFIGAVFDQSPPLIITELLDMNLRQAYEENQLDPGNRLSIFMDIALALNYLHQRYNPIIHRDVSAPNVLLQRMPNHQLKGKVSDLGSANFLQHAHTMGEGAIIYSPPEVIPQAFDPLTPPLRQSVKIDVYSYGIVLCEVTASRFPSAEHYRDMILQVQRQRPAVYELILHCTKREPSHRPSMAQVMVELNKIAPF